MRFPAGIILSLALTIAALAGAAAQTSAPTTATATFAGGCFWCTEADFDKVKGVISTTSGYIGGMAVNPTYEQVVTGRTGHTEAVEVVYDPAVVSYDRLLDVFWKNHDPLAKDRQFCDRGNQYRPGIFYHSEEQRALAEATKKTHQARFKQPIQTEITAATTFYKAEDYHQDYYKKNPTRYQFYRFNCGRDARLEELWGKPGIVTMLTRRNLVLGSTALASTAGLWWFYGSSEAMGRFEIERSNDEWRTLLTRAQFDVLRLHRTEAPGSSPLNNEKRKGTYACAGCALPLFSSDTKYDSRTGWPSFYQPLASALGTKRDYALLIPRTEVHCRRCGGHLGHVFEDGPPPTGLRYCINGVALTFEAALA